MIHGGPCRAGFEGIHRCTPPARRADLGHTTPTRGADLTRQLLTPSAPGPSRGHRFLVFDDDGAAAATPALIPKPPQLSGWEWTVFLLHTATEMEHALLVQYLYAAFSLADSGFTGSAVPADAADVASTWRDPDAATCTR